MSRERDAGSLAADRLHEIAHCSEAGEGVTRLPFTDWHRRANRMIEDWMKQAGMSVSLDSAGTLVGRLEGKGPRRGRTFILGSHQDSVKNGGRYDGIMGVALACLAVEHAFGDGDAPDCSIEVHAYADEEGVRFPTALLGPRALAGTIDPAVLDMADADGVRLRDAISDFGGEPNDIGNLARSSNEVLGYLEMHIEQGPVLEHEDLPTGVVTGICGIERNTVTISGRTGHAGTVPMQGRQDALVPAARIVAETHHLAGISSDIRATVGMLSILPGAVNQIPGTVSFTLEIRSPDDVERASFRSRIARYAERAASEQGCSITFEQTYVQTAQACDDHLTTLLCKASEAVQGRAFTLPSGATHDASAMAALCPIAMLFVRCRDGVSHVPEEHASREDMGQAIAIASGFLRTL